MIKNENVEGEPAYDETYRRGPVVMRGPMIPKDNTYANLLHNNIVQLELGQITPEEATADMKIQLELNLDDIIFE